ncbi:MAG: site-2 protease family protein [Syntrophorhabdus sp.]|jgi:membrane-associated protease RseP (regulator of RpoE activity)|nr:MAG: Peptidase family M50 [Syntrophorhabdus sp. PtaB.Bin027]OQB78058.1 MAG: Peptidase family M50 [Deltaproteobacteria bacterium ADurb.Bin135]HQH82700.1 site-2 protease family protein [Syntrophorhabdus sp.]HQM26657.1 site-2 protease family protein [Syntrophorhabdus sp.]HQP55843.1 site-2 protease family protein [Syntrophorhabdus sp.]
MSILLAHEMGHYFMSRKYGVPATLPYFIPLPFPPFGTLGAIIKMKGIIINKKALFDIGIAGPLSGFIVSIPFIILGIKMSTIQFVTSEMAYLRLGDPLLFKILQKILIGSIPEGYDLSLHPLAYAGWVGLFVTALNLLPIGQLDGGHIVYAVFGNKSKWIFAFSICLLAILTIFYNPGWLLLVILLLIFGMRHPEPFDMETELDSKRKLFALIILLVFLLSFTVSPFPGLTITNENTGIPV